MITAQVLASRASSFLYFYARGETEEEEEALTSNTFCICFPGTLLTATCCCRDP
jgi:hypothetical protein